MLRRVVKQMQAEFLGVGFLVYFGDLICQKRTGHTKMNTNLRTPRPQAVSQVLQRALENLGRQASST